MIHLSFRVYREGQSNMHNVELTVRFHQNLANAHHRDVTQVQLENVAQWP
jgi:hypothetical protein